MDIGILYALLFVLSNCSLSVVGRALKNTPNTIVIMIGCGFWALIMMFTNPSSPTGVFAVGSMFANIIIVAFAYFGIVFASKTISAPEVNLVRISETFFGSLLAWLLLNEVPSHENIIGGSVGIFAIAITLGYSIYNHRKRKSKIQSKTY